ncbi:hypothetical protein ACRQ1B_27240 [Rhizobium panacihumi]|uniref:hypothetical protein n=1 Tax=Rhizobium panacihumi TaxID=2008450 RepID=UPI003D7AF5C1
MLLVKKLVMKRRRRLENSGMSVTDWRRLETLGAMVIVIALMALVLDDAKGYTRGLVGICAGILIAVISFRVGRRTSSVPLGWILLGLSLSASGWWLGRSGQSAQIDGSFLMLQLFGAGVFLLESVCSPNRASRAWLEAGAITFGIVVLGSYLFTVQGIGLEPNASLAISVLLVGSSIFFSSRLSIKRHQSV